MRLKYAKKYNADPRCFLPRISHLKVNITYRCDRGCPNCNRATRLCPSSKSQDLDPKLFKNMLDECVKRGREWVRITLTGGEPTMHAKFDQFVDILIKYKTDHNPKCNIGTFTYHHPKYYYKIEQVLKKYPDFLINDTKKENTPRTHRWAIYKAPRDYPKYGSKYFYVGCKDERICGLGYDTTGFYCCPIGSAIARVFKLKVAIVNVSDLTVNNLIAQYSALCSRCGRYALYNTRKKNKDIISPSWEKAIKKYNE